MKNILFVCSDNSCLSQIAQAFAIIHGKNLVRASCAGIKPAIAISPLAVQVMKEVGYNLSIHETQSLQLFLFNEYEYAITLDCTTACLFVKNQYREDWSLDMTTKMSLNEFRRVRNTIEVKVKDLLNQIRLVSNNSLSIG